MPETVKLPDVEAEIERMCATLKVGTDRADQHGVTSRLMLAILPGAARFSAAEFNAGTPFPEILIALGSGVCNMLASEIANIDCTIEEKVEAINSFLRMVAAGTHQILTTPRNPNNSGFVKSSEGGNA